MSFLVVWYINSSRSTDEKNLIAHFFEMISAGAIKEVLLQMQFTWLIVYGISLWLFPLYKKRTLYWV